MNVDITKILLDIFIAVPLIWGAYQGYAKGILAELVGTIHFAIAFGLSFYMVTLLFKIAHYYIFAFEDKLFPELAFACSVIGAFGLLSTAGKYLKTEIEFDFPGAWDNVIGAMFGVLKYSLVVSFFFWFTTGFGDFRGSVKTDSFLFGIVENVCYQLLGMSGHQELSDAITNIILNP
ncbi:MAG: CvpA family protein [Bacteroidota bacterium]